MPAIAAATTTAVIQFIGLFVFSTKWSTDNHLQAIAPRVEHAAAAHAEKSGRMIGGPVTARPGQDAGVEPHAAIIAFPACSYVSSRGWAPKALENAPGFLYVRLDGERVTFVDSSVRRGGNKGGADREVVANARFNTSGAGELQLPKLTDCFKGMGKLKPTFVPGDSDVPKGTTAVFDLPAVGSARACRARVGDDASNTLLTRVDTVVDMSVGGDLIISAPNKQIRLNGATHVLVANVEATFIESGAGPKTFHSAPHYDVYFDMGLNNSGPSPDFAYRDYALKAVAAVKACEDVSAIKQIQTVPSGLPDFIARIDYECSNTQWP